MISVTLRYGIGMMPVLYLSPRNPVEKGRIKTRHNTSGIRSGTGDTITVTFVALKGANPVATLKELANRCNVSKMTVIRTIDSLGLRGEHVVKKGERGMLDIDDYAASLIADTLMKRAEPQPAKAEEPSFSPTLSEPAPRESETAEVYRSWIEDSRRAYEERIEGLKEQLIAKDAQIAQLTSLLEAQNASIERERDEAREASAALRDALVRANSATETLGRIKSATLRQRLFGFKGLLPPGE